MPVENSYTAESLEVLHGLDPVRKRPGMYTDTMRPNHLAQEVIDNSIDEAIVGFGDRISIVLFQDGSVDVIDIVIVVGYILDGLYNTEGDVNGDDVLNILDVVILTTLILGV